MESSEDLNNKSKQIKVSSDIGDLLDTATDCHRFVTEFFEVISESVPHIYHSALPLAPQSSIVKKLYSQQISSVARVVACPSSWDSCAATAAAKYRLGHAAWSPCGQYIAATSVVDIEVQNSTTLEVLYILKPPGLNYKMPDRLKFSPDGHLMICAYLIYKEDNSDVEEGSDVEGSSDVEESLDVEESSDVKENSDMEERLNLLTFFLYLYLSLYPGMVKLADLLFGTSKQVLSSRSSMLNWKFWKPITKKHLDSLRQSTLFSWILHPMLKPYLKIIEGEMSWNWNWGLTGLTRDSSTLLQASELVVD